MCWRVAVRQPPTCQNDEATLTASINMGQDPRCSACAAVLKSCCSALHCAVLGVMRAQVADAEPVTQVWA